MRYPKRSVYNPNAFTARVNYATKCLRSEYIGGRRFDACFEMGDGDLVAVALLRRAEKDEAFRSILFRHFGINPADPNDRWMKSLATFGHIPTAKLRTESHKMMLKIYAENDWDISELAH